MLDIPALSLLASRAPQHLKLRIYFCTNPNRRAESPNKGIHMFYEEKKWN